jgi:hypothetical protein
MAYGGRSYTGTHVREARQVDTPIFLTLLVVTLVVGAAMYMLANAREPWHAR